MNYTEEFMEWLYEEGKNHKTIQAYRTIVNQFTEWSDTTTGKQNLTEIKPIE